MDVGGGFEKSPKTIRSNRADGIPGIEPASRGIWESLKSFHTRIYNRMDFYMKFKQWTAWVGRSSLEANRRFPFTVLLFGTSYMGIMCGNTIHFVCTMIRRRKNTLKIVRHS